MIIEMVKVWNGGTEVACSLKRDDLNKADVRAIFSFLNMKNATTTMFKNTLIISVDDLNKEEIVYYLRQTFEGLKQI